MKNCVMCGTEKEDVSMMQVTPATWNGFNNFAEVCGDCQKTSRFKAKPKTAKSIAQAAADAAPVAAGSGKPSTHITHKKTGALLCTVEAHSLAGAQLGEATLSGADLQHAVLRGADLHRADLRLADLREADLRGADLRGVNLRGADLRGTDLREARLYKADLSHALYDTGTRWPADYDPHSSGASKEMRRG